MSRRTAKFVSALFASLFAGTPLVTVSHGATEAADSCLSGPKGTAPQGRHWYYRVDRATKRNCWYLGVQGEKIARAAAENPALLVRADPPLAAPSKNADTDKSIANARAEWPFPQTRIEQAPSSLAPQRTPAAPDAAEINQRANAGDAGDQRSVVATRWLDPANMAASAAPQTPATNSADPAASIFGSPAAVSGCRNDAGRSRRGAGKTNRLGSDAADRHARRVVGGRPDRKRDRQVRQIELERPRRHRRSPRELGIRQDPSSVAVGGCDGCGVDA